MSTPTPSPASSKTEWRIWAQEARRALDLPTLSKALCERLLPELATAKHVLLYAATEQELDVLGLISPPQPPSPDGKGEPQFYLPRCAANRQLAIHAWPCALTVSGFGIREPEATLPEVEPDLLDLVIVPALVLDARGFRLGYGGGYYDRFLPRLRPDCRTLGVAPFLVDTLPTDPWDVPVGILGGDLGGDFGRTERGG